MMTSSVMAIMIGVAICDLVSMIVAISIKDIIFNFIRDDCTPPISYSVYHAFLILMTIRDDVIKCSTWLGVAMAFIRFLVLRFTTKFKFVKATEVSVGFHVFGVFIVLSSILSVFNFMRTNIVEIGKWKPAQRCSEISLTSSWPMYEQRTSELFLANDKLLLRVFMLINGSVSKIVPCVLLPFLTVLLIGELHQKQLDSVSAHTSVHHNTERTTGLVIFVTFTFFVATLPAGIVTLFQVVYTDLGFLNLTIFIDHICNAILTANASIHCIICFAMSSQYRKTTKKLLGLQVIIQRNPKLESSRAIILKITYPVNCLKFIKSVNQPGNTS